MGPNLPEFQVGKVFNVQSRVALLPFCRLTLHVAKPTNIPKELRTLGDHLRKRRLELGLYQKEVAARLGVNEATVGNWEACSCAPSKRMRIRILGFLGYDPGAGQS